MTCKYFRLIFPSIYHGKEVMQLVELITTVMIIVFLLDTLTVSTAQVITLNVSMVAALE